MGDVKSIGVSFQAKLEASERSNKQSEEREAVLAIQRERETPYIETRDCPDNPDDMPVPHPDDAYVSLDEGNDAIYSYTDENGRPLYAPPGSPTAQIKTKGARRFSDMKTGTVQWLWSGFIPLGELIALSGDGGVGKTTISMTVTTAITRGEWGPAGNVLYFTKEGSLLNSIIPQLKQMGADVGKVIDLGDEEPLASLDDQRLIDLIEEQRPLAVIFDPITSYITSGDGAKVRAELTRLSGIAAKYNCTVINVNHMAKSGRGAYKVKGSVEFVNVPRVVLRAGKDPSDPGRYALTVSKTNIGEKDKSVGYVIDKGGLLRWTGPSDLTQDVMDAPPRKAKQGGGNHGGDADEAVKLEEAKAFLLRLLLPGVKIETKELAAMAEAEEGIKEGTLRRARKAVGVQYDYRGFGPNRETYCYLSGAGDEQSEQPLA